MHLDNFKVGPAIVSAELMEDYPGTHFVTYAYPSPAASTAVRAWMFRSDGMSEKGAKQMLTKAVHNLPGQVGKISVQEGAFLIFGNISEMDNLGGDNGVAGPLTLLELTPPSE